MDEYFKKIIDYMPFLSLCWTVIIFFVGKYGEHIKKFKKNHKLLKYSIRRYENDLIWCVCFWNASHHTLWCDDIYYLKIISDNFFDVAIEFSSDLNELLKIKKCCFLNKKKWTADLKFDFLCPKEGFILKIQCRERSDKINFVGRLKGEDRWSVQSNGKLSKNRREKFWNRLDRVLEKIVTITMIVLLFTSILSCIILLYSVIVLKENRVILIPYVIFFLLILAICIFLLFSNSLYNGKKMSYELRRRYNDIKKNTTKVEDSNELLKDWCTIVQ